MKEKRISTKAAMMELASRLMRDSNFDSGRIIGSMCTMPHPIARKIFASFIEKNLGDAGLFPATQEIEREAVQMIGKLLSNKRAEGHIVTGGTEANILALWTARKISKKAHGDVIVPRSAHCSFDKAADLLGLKLLKVRLNDRFQVDTSAVKRAMSPRTVAIVGIAGTTALGAVDPIERLSEIALEKEVYLHVDAAFGGFVLPFMKELGYDVPLFDFKCLGVSSITADPHKMGLAPIPAGGILFRDRDLMETVSLNIPYLSGGETEQTTVVGTRCGASALAVWAVMKCLGHEGYRRIVRRCMRLTRKLEAEVEKIDGLYVVTEPTMNVLGIGSKHADIRSLAAELRRRGWAVSLFPGHIRIVMMPHIKKEAYVQELVKDLRRITSNVEKNEEEGHA